MTDNPAQVDVGLAGSAYVHLWGAHRKVSSECYRSDFTGVRDDAGLENAPRPAAKVVTDSEHDNVDGEELEEYEAEHGGKPTLNDSSITVFLLQPGSDKNRQD